MVTNPDSDLWVYNPINTKTRKGSTLKGINFLKSEGSWVQKGPERAKKAKKCQIEEARELKRPESARNRERRPKRAKKGQKEPEEKKYLPPNFPQNFFLNKGFFFPLRFFGKGEKGKCQKEH